MKGDKMRRVTRCGLIIAGLILGSVSVVHAGSIWAKAHHPKPLYADDTASRVGDVLTIVIEEHSVIENESGRKLEKSSSRSASVSGNMDLLKVLDRATGKLFSIPDLSLDTEAENKFEGDTEYDSDRKITDEISATVTDVLPNRNLVIVGSRQRRVAGETEVVQVSGIVRPSDITFANTVSSDRMADFKLVFRHKGRENQFTRPGWLGEILNFLNPF